MTIVARPAPKPRFNVLRTIALYKLVKVLLLLALAYGEVRLSDASLAAKLVTWASARPLGLEHDVATRFLEWFSGLSASRRHETWRDELPFDFAMAASTAASPPPSVTWPAF